MPHAPGGARRRLRRGGSWGRNCTVIRPAPRATDAAASGTSSSPAAISSDPPPMSRSSSWPADHPNQRRTARKVSAASVSPSRTCSGWPSARSIRAITSVPLRASRTALVAVASSSSTFSASATRRACATADSRAATPSSEMEPSGVRYRISRSTERSLVVARGRPPGRTSAASMWTVLEPMSRTPRRTGRDYCRAVTMYP